MLARLRRDILGEGEGLACGRLAVIRERVTDAKRPRPGVGDQSAINSVGFAHLCFGELRGDRTPIGCELQGLDVERGLSGGGFFLRLEVVPDADAVEAAIDAEGERTVAGF